MFKTGLIMPGKPEYTVMLFFSNINQESLKIRLMIKEFMETHYYPFKVDVKEVNYDQDKSLSHQYGVMGTPALLMFKNQNLVRRHFGEITPEEFKSIIDGVSRS